MITTIAKNSILLASIVVSACLMVAVAEACYKSSPSASDQWSLPEEAFDSFVLYTVLKDSGWINEKVTFEEFDYISTLTQQLQTFYPNVRYSLMMSIIAMESRFDKDCKTGSAKGLTQLTPVIYGNRMEKFVEEGHLIDLDDLFDPRLNIMTGMDYFSYILDSVNGDEVYALMWYNQGAISASKMYVDQGITSKYAEHILELSHSPIWDEVMKGGT